MRADGRHDDDGLAGLVQAHGPPHRRQPLLEPREAGVALVVGQLVERDRRSGAHAVVLAAFSPITLNASTGRENPRSVSSPTGSDTRISSAAVWTRWLTST
jgi:hypothetical protein